MLIGGLTQSAIREAIIMLLLLVVFVRYALPSLFSFRTRIQKSLEETYETHISELKEMIDSQRETADQCKEKMAQQARQLSSINAKIVILGRILHEYNCRHSPECDNREAIARDIDSLVEQSSCDLCKSDTCRDCEYERILNS